VEQQVGDRPAAAPGRQQQVVVVEVGDQGGDVRVRVVKRGHDVVGSGKRHDWQA
jgi:hypothetical protein